MRSAGQAEEHDERAVVPLGDLAQRFKLRNRRYVRAEPVHRAFVETIPVMVHCTTVASGVARTYPAERTPRVAKCEVNGVACLVPVNVKLDVAAAGQG